MNWPSTQDYTEALTDTGLCFADEDLVDSTVDTDASGMPRPIRGNAASVYRVTKENRSWAVKCFHWHTDEHQKRYKALEAVLAKIDSSYFIKLEYIKQGIKARGAWYPIIKMEWVEGDTLETYILNNIQFPNRIANVKRDFKEMLALLKRYDLGHLDLQHGNIMVHMDRIRLVDYDVFYVPELAGLTSLELGHHNYQHPARIKAHFTPVIDNFGAWVIFASLHCLAIDTSLWFKLAGGDDCLLFRSEDFGNPFVSYAFAVLESHGSAEVRTTSKLLRSFIEKPIFDVPSVDETLASPINLTPLPAPSTVPAWIKSDQITQTSKNNRGFAYADFRAFNEAIKDPANFEDAELQKSFCYLDDTIVGKNGRIYHFKAPDRELAVKCFTYQVPERAKHYEAIKAALQGGLRPYVAQCHYSERGIKVNGEYSPILKMEWLSGKTITELKRARVNEPMASYLADRFADLMATLKREGVAHGDLNFDNIMVVDNDLKIVDYDAMFVPALTRMKALEAGEPSMQHPGRITDHFGPYIDNFSAWLVHYLIKMLYIKPNLNELVDACLADERQTLTAKKALRALETDREAEIRELGRLLRLLLNHKANAVPFLDIRGDFETVLKAQTQVAKEGTSTYSPFLKKKPK